MAQKTASSKAKSLKKPKTARSARQPSLNKALKTAGSKPLPEHIINRPDWDSYFLKIAQLVASRSTCLRRQVGAVIVKENRLLATGYNGAPNNTPHCFQLKGGCLREQMGIPSGERQELCRGLHAEQNAILQAAAFGVSLKKSVCYCTHQPCVTCAKMLINAGIKRVVYMGEYPDKLAVQMLKEGKVKLERAKVK